MDIEAILEMYEDDYNPSSMVPGPRNMASGGQVVIGKPGGLVQPGTKFYAIKKTIKGTGDNAGKFTTYVGGRDNQTMYIGSKDYIDKIRTLNQEKKYIGSNKEKEDIKKNIAGENKKAIKKNFKDTLGIDVEIGKNNLITGKGLTEELKQKIANAQSQYRKKNPGQAGLTNEGFWKYYSNIDKNKEAAATAAAEKEAAKMKAIDPKNIGALDRSLTKKEKLILYKSYDNIFKEEFDRLLNEGELFSKSDLNRSIINRIADENPTIDLTKGTGLDKIPGGGNEESKTLFENIDKKFTKKQKANFTTNTNALAYTKNQDRLLQALLAGNTDFDDLAEELGFNEGRLKGNVNKLMRNLAYTDKNKQPLFFKKYNQEDLEKARNAVFDSPTLEGSYQRTALQSILASTVEGSKQRKDALNKYKEFNKFKAVMKENGIDPKLVAMDHAASYRAIKNGNVKNFLAMTPIMSDINAIKSTFDRRSQLNLRRMQDAITSGDNASYKKFLKNQKELEGVWKTMTGDQSSLGKIRIGATGKKKGVTKIFDYGATSILDKNKNLLNELGDNLVIRENIVKASTEGNLDEVSRIMFEGSEAEKPRASKLPESFKNLNKPEMFKTENQIRTLLADLGCPKSLQKASGGRIKYSKGSSCAIKGREVLEKGLKNGFSKNQQSLAEGILKAGRGIGNMFALRNLLGPAAMGFTVAAEAGLVGYDMLSSGKSFKEAVGDSLFNYALGDKTKIDSDEERYKRYAGLGYDVDKIRNYENTMDRINEIGFQYDDLYGKANAVNIGGPRRSDAIKQKQQIISDKALAEIPAFSQDLYRTGEIPRLEEFVKNNFVSGAEEIQRADQEALIQQKESGGPKFMGMVFPRFEEGRQQDILNAQGILGYKPPSSTVSNYMSNLSEGGIASLNVNKK